MGNWQEAERNYLKALDKAEASGDSLMITMPRKGLAGVYYHTGDYDKALQAADLALRYYTSHRKADPTTYVYTLSLKARILLMEGHEEVAKAKVCVQEALENIPQEIMFDDVSEVYMAACEVYMAACEVAMARGAGICTEERTPRFRSDHCRQGWLYAFSRDIR